MATHAVGLDNEDVAEAIRLQSELSGLVLLANKALRDFYLAAVDSEGMAIVGMSAALRQILRAAVALHDVQTIAHLVSKLSEDVRRALDQSWYVSMIGEASVAAFNSLERSEKLSWNGQLRWHTTLLPSRKPEISWT